MKPKPTKIDDRARGIAAGKVRVIAVNVKTGERTTVVKKDNIVVNNFYSQLRYSLSGVAIADRVIDEISFGTDGTAAAATDNSITAPYTISVSSVSYPTTSSVEFVGTLGSGEANGKVIQEMGLFFHNTAPLLAARVAFDAVTKSSVFAWEVHWTITFGACTAGALNQIRAALCKLIGGDGADQYVDRMQFGTSTLAYDATQTGLQLAITPIKAITTVAYPTAYSVEFDGYLLSDEGNGFPISEAGLMLNDDTVVARTVFASKSKTEDYQLRVSLEVDLKG